MYLERRFLDGFGMIGGTKNSRRLCKEICTREDRTDSMASKKNPNTS